MSRTCTGPARRNATPLLALSVLLLCPLPSFATLLRPLSVEQLADLSDVVVRGRVETVEVVWNDRVTMPITRVRLDVIETIEGEAGARRITLTVPGGERDGVALDYLGRPRFEPGEEVVLFLQRRPTGAFLPVGLAQGRLEVERDAATGGHALRRDLAGAALLPGASDPGGPANLEALRGRLRARPRLPRTAAR